MKPDIHTRCVPEHQDDKKQYEKGWDDAVSRMGDLVNSLFAGQHDRLPQENGLDAVSAQQGDAEETIQDDPVNHPSHYRAGTRFEVIEIIEDQKLPYHLGNAIKYICRAGRKDPNKITEDLRKAVWYLNRYIGLLENQEGGAA